MNGAFIQRDGLAFEHVEQFACPCCGTGLWIAKTAIISPGFIHQVTVFCGNGSCESRLTTLGATGPDIDAAVNALAEAVEEERAREYWAHTLITEHDLVS